MSWRLPISAWAGWWPVTPTPPTLGPSSPSNGPHRRALPTTPSPSSLMSGVSSAAFPASFCRLELIFSVLIFDPLNSFLRQLLECYFGKLPLMACLPTRVSICLRSTISWRKAIAWSNLRDARPKFMSWWGHVSACFFFYLTVAAPHFRDTQGVLVCTCLNEVKQQLCVNLHNVFQEIQKSINKPKKQRLTAW